MNQTRCLWRPLRRSKINSLATSGSPPFAALLSRYSTTKESSAESNNGLKYGIIGGAVILSVATGGYLLGKGSSQSDQLRSTLSLESTQPLSLTTDISKIRAAATEFVAIVGEENVSDVVDDLERHSTSDWTAHEWNPAHQPVLIIYPASTEEVSKVVKVCHAKRIPVTGYSGGTSLEGHYTPTHGGISINFSRMDKVLAVHQDDLDVVVQPAVQWQKLNQDLANQNLFFPPDPGPGAMIGGMVSTGCSGTNTYRYGTIRDWVLNLTVVLADGTVIKTRRRPRKSSAGYNLTQLFIGSEGTLGLVTEATLKLTPIPESTSVAVCSFGTLRQAATCVASIVGRGMQLAAIELLDDNQIKYLNNFVGDSGTKRNEAPTLFLKFGGTPDSVKEQIRITENLARDAGSLSFEFARNKKEEADLWSSRRDALWATMSIMKENDRFLTSDVAVPISRLPEAIEQAKDHMDELGLVGAIVGHAGDGNFHTLVVYGEDQKHKAEDFLHKMVDRALEMEGTCTGEHGVGLGKREAVVQELGEDTVAAMRKIKQAYDPLCLLNCDKIFQAKKTTA